VVTNVRSGSPAASAGLRAGKEIGSAFGIDFPRSGDVIVAIEGSRVSGSEDIARIVTSMSPGQVAHFTVERGGSRLDLPVRLSERSETH
jgi:S1-C subfamily serine protease